MQTVNSSFFATGATLLEAKEEIDKLMHRNFGESSIPHFYKPSGLCYEKMGLADKTIMKALLVFLVNKENKSEIENGTITAISESYDISDKKYIQPLLECVQDIQRSTGSCEKHCE